MSIDSIQWLVGYYLSISCLAVLIEQVKRGFRVNSAEFALVYLSIRMPEPYKF